MHFPKESALFARACEQGIYEPNITRLLISLTKSGSTFFDVGANIGLTSVPVLASSSNNSVVSFEPSPSCLESLRKTYGQSAFTDRWKIISKAVGRSSGVTDFFISSPSLSNYDGIVDTGRSGERQKISVEITTLDKAWSELGRPAVSAIKIDVEGAESDVIAGAEELITSQKPSVVLEWYEGNLIPYGRDPASLLEIAARLHYKVLSIPGLVPIEETRVMRAHMITADGFLLIG